MTEATIMEAAWLSFIQFAWSEPDMRAAFTAETGIAIPGPRSGIEMLVDKACGVDPVSDAMHAFVEWATRTHWGIESAPKAYLESLTAKTSKPAKRRKRAR